MARISLALALACAVSSAAAAAAQIDLAKARPRALSQARSPARGLKVWPKTQARKARGFWAKPVGSRQEPVFA
ncbi:hypothetical protein CNMCM5793_001010 [Aspergillus hiratsukae]|uniref:Uncharacterized protein n=1 Tax=Aspergillus hiratsukae TaxID=1194566 RepID=A0A8H6PIS4_9EURO|nr:hypothetical protein CNMCM5793_001010 [Aspergillus hiratsukae]